MPEINQLFFSHKEIIEMLLKKANIHEGRWMLSVNFGLGAGNFGTVPEQIAPGAIVTVLGVGLQRAAADTPQVITLDASVVNPAPEATGVKRKRT